MTHDTTTLRDASAERLNAHVEHLAHTLGDRKPGSDAERQAAAYVREQLRAAGIDDVREQPFRTPSTASASVIPYIGAALVANLLGRAGRIGRILGGAGMIAAAWGLRRALGGAPIPYLPLVATADSVNVIARIPPRSQVKRFVIVMAHLDSGAPSFGLVGRHTPGANDNASGIAALIELGGMLHAEPLDHIEVVLLFTGAHGANSVGINAYLDQYAPPKDFTTFINVLAVGARGAPLAYLHASGVFAFSMTRPSPQITALVNRAANQHPEYGVYGRRAARLDDTSAVRARGYAGITLAGVSRAGQVTDAPLNAIDPEQIARAVGFVRRVLAALDG
ncbi:MAG: M28 family peptidase [bacterium]|nr:M28 family peptidase [bacterium]